VDYISEYVFFGILLFFFFLEKSLPPKKKIASTSDEKMGAFFLFCDFGNVVFFGWRDIFLFLVFLPDYVRRYATEEALREQEQKDKQPSDDESESSMSDFSEDETGDMEL